MPLEPDKLPRTTDRPRRRRRISPFWVCIAISVLLHALLVVQFNWIALSRSVLRFVREEIGMEIPLNLEASRVAEVQLQVRNQITDLPATPSKVEMARVDSANAIAEPAPDLAVVVPHAMARPGQMVVAVAAPTVDPPASVEPVALATPLVEVELPPLQLMMPVPVAQTEAAPQPEAALPQTEPVELRAAARAEQIVLGTVPLQPDTMVTGPAMVSLTTSVPTAQPVDAPAPSDLVSSLRVDLPALEFTPVFEATSAPATQPAVMSVPQQTGALSSTSAATELPVPKVVAREASRVGLAIEPATDVPVEPIVHPPTVEPLAVAPPAVGLPAGGVEEAVVAAPVERIDVPLAQSDVGRREDLKPPESLLPVEPVANAAIDCIGEAASEVRTVEPVVEALGLSTPISAVTSSLGPRDLVTMDLLAHRSQDQRKPLIEELGGTQQTEEAVGRALAWLAKNQASDGRWTRFTEPQFKGRGKSDHDAALTALACLCFLGADHTPAKAGPYQKNVALAIAWLAEQQKKDGSLAGGGNMYDHAMATIAICEAVGMTGERRHRDVAFKAAQYIVASQRQETGGWQYFPGDFGDTSVLGWQVMALRSAENIGFAIPDKTRQLAFVWLQRVTQQGDSLLAGYQNRTPATPALTAQATLSRILLGQRFSPRAAREASAFIARYPPGVQAEKDPYYWYCASMALMQLQNDTWTRWNLHTREHIVKSQLRDGAAAGSWDPQVKWSERGGRVYSTAMHTLTLEVYYRYLPIYSAGSPAR